MNSEFPFITFISLFADDLRLLPVAYNRNEGQSVRPNSDEVEAAISFAIEPSLSSGLSGEKRVAVVFGDWPEPVDVLLGGR